MTSLEFQFQPTAAAAAAAAAAASLSFDTILTSGEEHVWLVKREDAAKYATVGGFVEVSESIAEACARELKEEMILDLDTFGAFSHGHASIVPFLEGIQIC